MATLEKDGQFQIKTDYRTTCKINEREKERHIKYKLTLG